MIGLINLISGYVRIKVCGVSPKRFINLCANRNILLWQITEMEDGYEMCISLNAFRLIRPIAKKTKTKVVLLERCGLPFFMSKILKRKIFLLGFIATVLLCFYCSSLIWRIQISGNEMIESTQILSFLSNQSIHTGTKREDIQIETLEEELRKEFDSITWANIRVKGITLIIELKENEYLHHNNLLNDENIKVPCDLIAACEGQIDYIIVRSGVPKVKVGDMVSVDQVLVEGKVPIYNEDGSIKEYLYVTGDADIGIKHIMIKNFRLPYVYYKKNYTGNVLKGLNFTWKNSNWNLSPKITFENYDSFTKKQSKNILETIGIPLSFRGIIYKEYEKIPLEYNLTEVQTLFEEKLYEFLSQLDEKGVQIIEKNGKIDSDVNGWIYECDFIVIETIQKKNPIQMKE